MNSIRHLFKLEICVRSWDNFVAEIIFIRFIITCFPPNKFLYFSLFFSYLLTCFSYLFLCSLPYAFSSLLFLFLFFLNILLLFLPIFTFLSLLFLTILVSFPFLGYPYLSKKPIITSSFFSLVFFTTSFFWHHIKTSFALPRLIFSMIWSSNNCYLTSDDTANNFRSSLLSSKFTS